MQEQVNEKISLLMDDELQSSQAFSLLNSLQQDKNARYTMQRYQLISQVLKNDDCCLIDKSFAEKIHQQIQYEPVWLLPAKKSPVNWRKVSLALAASITATVIWVTHNMDKQQSPTLPQPALVVIDQQQLPTSPMDPRLADYLQAHDNAVYGNNTPSVRPFARVVGYQQQ